MPEVYVITETFSVCKDCDKDTDILDVPDEACGHDRETHGKAVSLQFVPKRDYDAALKIIRDLVEHEDTGCSYDHHGYCQEHGYFETDPPCSIARGRALLGLDT